MCPLVGGGPGSAGCEWFEKHLLPSAPRHVREDYTYRLTPYPARRSALPPLAEIRNAKHFNAVLKESGEAEKRRHTCSLRCREPMRCGYFERCILPASPRHIADEYNALFPDCRVAFGRLEKLHGETSDRGCPDCGGPLRKRHRRCKACRQAARRERDRQKKRRSRNSGRYVPPGTNLQVPETSDRGQISRG